MLWLPIAAIGLALVHLGIWARRKAHEIRRNLPDPRWHQPRLVPRFVGFDSEAYTRGREASVRRRIARLEATLPERPAARLVAVTRARVGGTTR